MAAKTDVRLANTLAAFDRMVGAIEATDVSEALRTVAPGRRDLTDWLEGFFGLDPVAFPAMAKAAAKVEALRAEQVTWLRDLAANDKVERETFTGDVLDALGI